MIIAKEKLVRKYLYFTIIAVIIIDTIRYLSFRSIKSSYGSTIAAFLVYFSTVLIIYGISKLKKRESNLSTKFIFTLWLLYAIINVFRGVYVSGGYWDYRFLFLTSVPFLFVFMLFYIGQNVLITRDLLKFYFKRAIFLILLIFPIVHSFSPQVFSRLVISFGVLVLFVPYLKTKWKAFIIAITIISILSNPSFRTNVIKTSISSLILLTYYFAILHKPFFLKIIFISVICTPLVLLWMGLFGNFNLFNELSKKEVVKVESRYGEMQSQTVDTRTFLYYEVISDVVKNKSLLFGKSPSKGYYSKFFAERNAGGFHNGTRYRSEVHLLNILLHYGLFGALLYVILLLNISYLGLFKSNNILAKMLGLLILSRYLLSFLEEFTQFDVNFYFFWLIAGLLSSKSFRSMSNYEVKMWFSEKSHKLNFRNQLYG